MNVSNFGGKRSRVKVMVGSNIPQNALLGFVVVTCWQRRNSRRSRNHRLVFKFFLIIFCGSGVTFGTEHALYCSKKQLKFC